MVKSITGYGDKISVRPGDTVRFMVSCASPQPYRARLVCVVCGDRNPAGPGVKLPAVPSAIDGTYQGRHQPINPGPMCWCRPRRRLPAWRGSPCRR